MSHHFIRTGCPAVVDEILSISESRDSEEVDTFRKCWWEREDTNASDGYGCEVDVRDRLSPPKLPHVRRIGALQARARVSPEGTLIRVLCLLKYGCRCMRHECYNLRKS